MALKVSARKAAEIAIASIGRGYDLASDLRLKYYKGDAKDSPLIDFGYHDITLPDGIHIPNVSKLIKCSKGERLRYTSDSVSFEQMSEQFNHEMSLSGNIPSGFFNTIFYGEKSLIRLSEHVKKAVPSSWEPAALARFIKTFGTHIIVGVKMGGKDVLYVKQQCSSTVRPADVHTELKKMADEKFIENNGQNTIDSEQVKLNNEDISIICKRRGGREEMNLSYAEWLHTVQVQPDVVLMFFIPITSLLTGVPGSGLLSHAIYRYLTYKPPLEELHTFLEFQLPTQWAPVFNEFPHASRQKQQINSFLKFNFLGPKLYVNTIPVNIYFCPLLIFAVFSFFGSASKSYDKRCFKKVRWMSFSRVCTAPIEPYHDHSIVTGAQLQVEKSGRIKILFLRLHFCNVLGTIRHSEWDESSGFAPLLGAVPAFISSRSLRKHPPQPKSHTLSAIYSGGPPVPNYPPKLWKLVDTAEKKRGPKDPLGYWVVSGARLVVEKGKIALRLKYSLMTAITW
ncbi:hypothetical protein DITRI_Ditri01bG0010400 [Diplodiscus trichospermus]